MVQLIDPIPVAVIGSSKSDPRALLMPAPSMLGLALRSEATQSSAVVGEG